jgi:transcriptional regulator with XRE-family HTH domain
MVVEPQSELSFTAQVGRQIMLVRTERGMLQGDLAAGAKLKQSQMCGIERGKRPITIEHLANFARVLRCSVVDLLPPSAKSKPIT